MFQAAKGIALGEVYGTPARFLDLTERDAFNRKWELGVFGLLATEPTFAEHLILQSRLRLAKKARRLGRHRFMGVLNESLPGNKTPLPPRVPAVVNGFWQQPINFTGSAEIAVRKTFSFPSHAAIEAFTRAPGNPVRVGIHVRRGDFVSHAAASQRHLVCDVEWYRRAWNQMRSSLGNCQGFVFSDEPNWARDNLRLEGHVQIMESLTDHPPWIDMARMSRCDHFIISNSSYSWWAAFLSNGNGKQVIAPAYWFSGTLTRNIGICPADWTIL